MSVVVPSDRWDVAKIDFGRTQHGKAKWVATSVDWAEDRACDWSHNMPTWMRIYLLALSRVDGHGHARFGIGELRNLLERFNVETGEVVKPDRGTIGDALATLKKFGLISPDSGHRCVRMDRQAVQCTKQPADCAIH